ncbi:MAG: hypothetical protein HY330_03060 [Chloroflexi bacterium]|nr:hypothetical protein [Chloroflexota bacterium]
MQSEDGPAPETGGPALPEGVGELVELYLDNLRRLHLPPVDEVAAVPMGELTLIETVVPGLSDDLRLRLHAVQGLIAKRMPGLAVAFREIARPADSWPGFPRHVLYRREP